MLEIDATAMASRKNMALPRRTTILIEALSLDISPLDFTEKLKIVSPIFTG
jgi:hypothetical protein